MIYDYVTLGDFARMCGCAHSTAARMVDEKRIPAFKWRRIWLVPRAAAETFASRYTTTNRRETA